MTEDNWLAKELKKNRKSRRLTYIGSVVVVCLLVGALLLFYHSHKHNVSDKLTSVSVPSQSDDNMSISGSSEASPSTSVTPTPTTPPSSQPKQLPTTLTSSDANIFTRTFNDAYTYAGDIDANNTSASYQDGTVLSNDIQAIKDINLNNYAFSTGSTIISVESDVTIAYNQYTQAYSDASAVAELNGSASTYQTEINSDNQQKQSDITDANESIQSAETALTGIE